MFLSISPLLMGFDVTSYLKGKDRNRERRRCDQKFVPYQHKITSLVG